MIKKIIPTLVAMGALMFSFWIEHQVSFIGLQIHPWVTPVVWGIILAGICILSLIIARKTRSTRKGILKHLHVFILMLAIIISAFGSLLRSALKPNELYSANLFPRGLTDYCTIHLMDDNSYVIYHSGCFHREQYSGEQRIQNDTLYIENFNYLKDSLRVFHHDVNFKVRFSPIDSASQDMFMVVSGL